MPLLDGVWGIYECAFPFQQEANSFLNDYIILKLFLKEVAKP